MSATSPGAVRRVDDDYVTPAWATELILPHLATPRTVLEPASGRGDMKRCIEAHWPTAIVAGVELDAERAKASGSVCSDFLHCSLFATYDLVITNPPFSRAMAFLERAFRIFQPSTGEVAMLLRLAFLESEKRVLFHRTHPSDVYVFAQRPSFTEGGTDSAAYAWFVWGPRRGNRWFILDRNSLFYPLRNCS